MGYFSSPVVIEKLLGPYTYAYEEYIGDYSKTGPVFENVNLSLEHNGIHSHLGIGIYKDNPELVEANNRRSDLGFVIQEDEIGKINSKLKLGKIESKKSILVEFPLKNFLSYPFAAMKCYPILSAYLKNKGLNAESSYELYDSEKGIITIVMIIEK